MTTSFSLRTLSRDDILHHRQAFIAMKICTDFGHYLTSPQIFVVFGLTRIVEHG